MGQNMFSRHLPKVCYSSKSELANEAKHHKENCLLNGKTTIGGIQSDDLPPYKRRRLFPNSNTEISLEKHEPFASREYPVADNADRKMLRRRSFGSLPTKMASDSSLPTPSNLSVKVLQSRPNPIGKKATARKSVRGDGYHELRSSKACPWIRDGQLLAQAELFRPPPFPDTNHVSSNLKFHESVGDNAEVVEVPCFRRNPVKTVQQTKTTSRRNTQLLEDITDDAFYRRHRKSEDLEKRIVRWDRQRQRELEYYEYLKQRAAQRKTSYFAPKLHPVTSNSITPSAGGISKPTAACSSSNLERIRARRFTTSDHHEPNASAIWPCIENIQFIEILPSDKELVNVTFLGRPLPAIDKKVGFALPWSVDVSLNPSLKRKLSSRLPPAEETGHLQKSAVQIAVRRKVNAAKANIIKATRRSDAVATPSTSSHSLPSRSASLLKSSRNGEVDSVLTTRHGRYAKPRSFVSCLSVPVRRRSQRIRQNSI